MASTKSKCRLVIPNQVGPLTLPEIVDFFCNAVEHNFDMKTVESDLAKRAAALEEKLQEKDQNLKQDMIKSLFESNRVEAPDTHFTALYHQWSQENRGDKRPRVTSYDYNEGTPDSLACYRSLSGFRSARGIYFHVERVLKALQSKALDPTYSIRTIAIHELLHLFVESMMDDSLYLLHGQSKSLGSSWCLLEEAAANAVAREWLLANAGKRKLAAIDQWLFHPKYDGRVGLKGYGEWDKLDSTSVSGFLVPILEQGLWLNGWIADEPEKYTMYVNCLCTGYSQQLDIKRREGEQSWKNILADMDGMRVPFFLDFISAQS